MRKYSFIYEHNYLIFNGTKTFCDRFEKMKRIVSQFKKENCILEMNSKFQFNYFSFKKSIEKVSLFNLDSYYR